MVSVRLWTSSAKVCWVPRSFRLVVIRYRRCVGLLGRDAEMPKKQPTKAQRRGPAPYYFVTVPEEQSQELRAASSGSHYSRGGAFCSSHSETGGA